MRVQELNGVKVYNVSSDKAVPEWLTEKRKRALRKDEEYIGRVTLLQDLEFPVASTKLHATTDETYLFASGTYKPLVKCYDLDQLSLKFERHFDSEIVDFRVLTEDFTKLAFVCEDRSVILHAKFGHYHKTRVPKQPRCVEFDPKSADLLIGSSSPQIYRLNLDQGRFLAPYVSESSAVNWISKSNFCSLLGAATDGGFLEGYDSRQKTLAARLDTKAGIASATETPLSSLTVVKFSETDPFKVAVGTDTGCVALYDLRRPEPVIVKDHNFGLPIRNLFFLESSADPSSSSSYSFSAADQLDSSHYLLGSEKRILSSDSRSIKIWNTSNGKNYTTIEPPEEAGEINDVCWIRDSGLFIAAMDAPKIQSWFVPSLGPAPQWCSFLESITEEMEETQGKSLYDDFKFVTRDELHQLGLSHLAGTNLLRGYMHGFFVDHRLYIKAKKITEPFAYEKYREARITQKLQEERGSRITPKTKRKKVNSALAQKLEANVIEQENKQETGENDEDEEQPESLSKREKKRRKDAAVGKSLLEDDRFAAMWADPRFEIDVDSADYKQLHPNSGGSSKHPDAESEDLLEEHFEDVEYSDGDNDDGADDTNAEKVRMMAAKDSAHAAAYEEDRSLRNAAGESEDEVDFEDRVAQLKNSGGFDKRATVRTGAMEMKFDQGGPPEKSALARNAKALPSSSSSFDRPSSTGRDQGETHHKRRSMSRLLPRESSAFGRGGRGGRGGRARGGRGRGRGRSRGRRH